MLSVKLFGQFRVTLRGEIVSQFDANTARGLLAYLVTNKGTGYSRESLAEMFWPDQPIETSLRNLRQALLRLRRALDEQEDDPLYIVTTRQTVEFVPKAPYSLDIEEFEQLYNTAKKHSHRSLQACPLCIQRMEKAVQLYQGQFLSGFYLESLLFEEWQVVQRENYHRQVMEILYALADFYEQRSNYSKVQELARRQLILEPWLEEAHRQLMRALSAVGQRSAALAQYKICVETLKREFQAQPSSETIALYEAIKNTNTQPVVKQAIYSLTNTNLPRQASSFIGREQERVKILEWLTDPTNRLVNLVGPGGVGKTCLALNVARELLGSFQDGVWLIPLAGLDAEEKSPDDEEVLIGENPVVKVLFRVLGLAFSGEISSKERLLAYLASKEMLLLMDNLEYVQENGKQLILEILRHCRQISILVTSHQRLNLQAERVLVLEGLPIPALLGDINDIRRRLDKLDEKESDDSFASVQLFAERARQSSPTFTLDHQNVHDIAQICRLVDGLPLGIELAAAGAHYASLKEISAEIERDLGSLMVTREDQPVRHRSLRAVFDYSWNLLSSQEKQIFASVSVFRGGFTLQAAEYVVGASRSFLTGLAEKSLLRIGATGRMDLHEAVRLFAKEKFLSWKDEYTRNVFRLHGSFYLRFAQDQQPVLYGWQPLDALENIQQELDNIRSAWLWATQNNAQFTDLEQCLRALQRYYALRGDFTHGQVLFEAAIQSATTVLSTSDQPDTNKHLILFVGKLYYAQATLLGLQGNHASALEYTRQAREFAVRAKDGMLITDIDLLKASLLADQIQLDEAFALSGSVLTQPDLTHSQLAQACFVLGKISQSKGDLDSAYNYFRQSFMLYHQLHDIVAENKAADQLGWISYELGNLWEPLSYWQDFLMLSRSLGDRVSEEDALNSLGHCYLSLGDFTASQAHTVEALALSRELGSQQDEGENLLLLSQLWLAQEDAMVSLRFAQQARMLAFKLGNRSIEIDALEQIGASALILKDWQTAKNVFDEVLSYHQENSPPKRTLCSQANLIDLYQQIGQTQQAYQLAQEILSDLVGKGRQITGFIPLSVFVSCWRILDAWMDEQAAVILEIAYDRLQSQANLIESAEARQTFLENIPANRSILAAYQPKFYLQK